MALACYVGFSRLYHVRFLKREPMLLGVLAALRLPPQSSVNTPKPATREHFKTGHP
jgi:hypothetical protein